MVDYKLIIEDPEKFKQEASKKGVDPLLVDKFVEIEKQRKALQIEVEGIRMQRNEIASTKTPEAFEKGRLLKDQLKEKEIKFEEVNKEYKTVLNSIPNLPLEEVPVGKGETENVELKVVGEKPQFEFTPLDHVELGKKLDILDFENGAKVAGSGFYYLKNAGAMLEIALVNYGLQFLTHRGFSPIITPDLAKEKFYLGTGYNPKGNEAQTYIVADSDLGLIATAEVTIAGYHADEIIEDLSKPKLYGGYSHCFRQESGAYGKYSKGLYRVHQFTKVEMFAYTNKEDSKKVHEQFLQLEEEFWTSLGIPYRVLEMCTGDLGSQAARKFDLEAWMPGRDDWGEVTSTSNTTDYQARNLNIRYREGEKIEYAHMLNGTLVATSRAIIAILENFQQEDGSIKIPEVLIPFIGTSVIKPV